MPRYTIAVLPGDGVGPEVMQQAVRILQVMAARHRFELELLEGLIGEAALAVGERVLPPETLRLCKDANAVLMGPVGGSHWDDALSTSHPKQAVLKLRAWLNSYATLRRLRNERGMDLTLVYDHSSGLFYGTPRGIETAADGNRTATNTEVYSDVEARRTMKLAFEIAKTRRGYVQAVDHAKYLETGQIWRDAALSIAKEFPEIRCQREDAAHFFFDFASDPTRYDVIVSEMTLGHLLSSVAMASTASQHIHAAAYLGGDVPLFQPSHGSAPDIAGRGVANPLGQIRAVALMLCYGIDQPDAALELDSAIEAVVADYLTHHQPADNTVALAERVLAALQAMPICPATATPTISFAPVVESAPAEHAAPPS